MDKVIEKKSWANRNLKFIVIGTITCILLVYSFSRLTDRNKLAVDPVKLNITEVREDLFLEYLDVEGMVHPVSTVKINASEDGIVKELLLEEGSVVESGDMILLLDNPNLRRQIEEEESELEKQRINYREKLIEMEQTSINLQKSMLQAQFETKNLEKKFELDKQEHEMGVMSKARFEIAKDEYEYNVARNKLTMVELRNDSLTREIRIEMLKSDLKRQVKKFEQSKERLDNLRIQALINGQLSLVKRPEVGEMITRGQDIGEIKNISRFKLNGKISEHYVDRVMQGQNAFIVHAAKRYELSISRVTPEIKDGKFDVDFSFIDSIPENMNLGKSFRVQIELSKPETRIVMSRGTFFQHTGGKWIFKIAPSGDRAYKHYITLGRQNPSQYEIIEGLAAGDKVVVSGYDYFGDADELIIK